MGGCETRRKHHDENDLMSGVRRNDLRQRQHLPALRCNFQLHLVAPVGIAIMLVITLLYALFQRYW